MPLRCTRAYSHGITDVRSRVKRNDESIRNRKELTRVARRIRPWERDEPARPGSSVVLSDRRERLIVRGRLLSLDFGGTAGTIAGRQDSS